jgi:hypothetical protein
MAPEEHRFDRAGFEWRHRKDGTWRRVFDGLLATSLATAETHVFEDAA